MLLNSCWQFGDILSLCRNNRISSFYWIRGSKHSFLTSFSNLNCYFFSSIFAQLLLTSFFAPFSVVWESNFSSRFLYLCFSKYHVLHTPPYSWHTWRVFSKQDACGNLVQELVPVSRSAFCQRFLMQTSIGSLQIIPFLLTQCSSHWHFVTRHKPMLSQCSTVQARNPRGISKVVNQGWLLLVWQQLLDDFTSALCTWLLSSWFLALCSIW